MKNLVDQPSREVLLSLEIWSEGMCDIRQPGAQRPWASPECNDIPVGE